MKPGDLVKDKYAYDRRNQVGVVVRYHKSHPSFDSASCCEVWWSGESSISFRAIGYLEVLK